MASAAAVFTLIANGAAALTAAFNFLYNMFSRLWQGPVAMAIGAYNAGEADRHLKKKLGEWADEARDSQGRWQQPILTRVAFDRHLEDSKGHFQPTEECTSSFAWAKLLYALNIRPKKGLSPGVLSWRELPADARDPAVAGSMSLAIEGPVFCHLLNLYQNYTAATARSAKSIQMLFGELKLEGDVQSHRYRFNSIGMDALRSQRKPFPYSMRDSSGHRRDHMSFAADSVVKRYQQTLEHGIDDEELRLNDVAKPLTVRVQLLLRSMQLMNKRDWKKPMLLTHSWINFASRIKRKATTHGGKIDFLEKHVEEFIAQNDGIVKRLREPLRDESQWRSLLDSTVRGFFMYDTDKYDFIWNVDAELSSRENPRFVTIVKSQLLPALQNLSQTESGKAWLKTIDETVEAEDVLEVLETPHVILNAPVIIIQHLPDSGEWQFIGEILA